MNLRAPEGTSLESTDVLTNRVANTIRQRIPEVDYTLVAVGADPAKTRNLGNIYVRLKPIEERSRDQFEVMDVIRKQILPTFTAGLRTSVQEVAVIGGGGSQSAAIQFAINGPDLRKLEVISRQLVDRVKSIPGVVDIDTTLNTGKPELSVQVDRPKAADLGVQIGDAAEALRWLVGGDQVTTYNEGGEQYEVHLRARAEDRTTQAAIAALTVPSSRLGSVSLENIADFAPGSSPTDINRQARQRQVTVFCNLLPSASQATIQNTMLAEFAKLNVGGDYRGVLVGRSRELGRAAQNFVLAFLLSLIFMYLILAAQFESWLHPITILLCAVVDHPVPPVAEHLLRARPAGAVRRREEELHSADRPREPAEGHRPVDPRRRRSRQPRSSAADSDDDLRVRRRHDPADRLTRDRRRHEPRNRLRDLRRPDDGAAVDARRDAGRLLALRRRREGPDLRPRQGEAGDGGAGALARRGVKTVPHD